MINEDIIKGMIKGLTEEAAFKKVSELIGNVNMADEELVKKLKKHEKKLYLFTSFGMECVIEESMFWYKVEAFARGLWGEDDEWWYGERGIKKKIAQYIRDSRTGLKF